ncbi:MAG: protein kinase domain-containing protein [Gemmatimonadota bacterium]
MTRWREVPVSPFAGAYTIERELGEGGMATVYLARDQRLGRQVAIKMLHEPMASRVEAEHFLSEIQTTAQLQHPNILPVLDSGESGGQLYYVMPYVAGGSLRARLDRERTIAVDESVTLVRGVAAALGFAHRHGVIHRDVKPENILLHEGEPMVADFGIALAVNRAETERLTLTGLTLGTPSFMSPEQIAGTRALDGRSDQYSLACVLYEMISGHPPFTAPTPQGVCVKHATEVAPSLQTVAGDVPHAVGRAVARALEKDPDARFPDICEFATALASPTEAHQSPQTMVASLAVLPFTSVGRDPDAASFAEGLTEEIIADLSRSHRLPVSSRASVMRVQEGVRDLATIARALSVRYVMEGSVRRSGRSLRITAALVDAQSGYCLWGDTLTGDLNDVFETQERVAGAIALAIAKVTSKRPAARVGAFAAGFE